MYDQVHGHESANARYDGDLSPGVLTRIDTLDTLNVVKDSALEARTTADEAELAALQIGAVVQQQLELDAGAPQST